MTSKYDRTTRALRSAIDYEARATEFKGRAKLRTALNLQPTANGRQHPAHAAAPPRSTLTAARPPVRRRS